MWPSSTKAQSVKPAETPVPNLSLPLFDCHHVAISATSGKLDG
jgi:hypothetical protein